MTTKQIDIRFEGQKFIPSILRNETNWPLNILVEAGQISPKGIYKGKPSPYGIAYFTVNLDLENGDPIKTIDTYSDRLIKHKKILQKSGVEEIIFDVETSNSQEYSYNLENKIINKLHKLNARVDFHGNETEIAFDTFVNDIYMNFSKVLNIEELHKFEVIRNKINETPNIHAFNISHAYEFFIYYLIKYMNVKEPKIPSFRDSFMEYNKEK